MDEMYSKPTKRGGSGFVGKQGICQKTLVYGAVEVDVDRRCMTGRGILRVIPNTSKKIMKRIVHTCVRGGSDSPDASPQAKVPVWMDELKSYAFLSQPDSGYLRTSVNHSEGVYATALGRGGNAAECLFRLVCADLRKMCLKFPKKPLPGGHGGHAPWFAEFLWRLESLGPGSNLPKRSWPLVAFWRLCHTLGRVQNDDAFGSPPPTFALYQLKKEDKKAIETVIPTIHFDSRRTPIPKDQV